jgi:hypothetical protein
MNDNHDNAATDREALARHAAPAGEPPATTSLDGEDLINIEDVTARIADLEAHDCKEPDRDDYPCTNVYECATCHPDTERELTALRELLAEMEPVKKYAGRATAIRDGYMDEFTRNEIDDVCGSDAVSILSPYIDWDELTGDRAGEMTETKFLGTTYYITP